MVDARRLSRRFTCTARFFAAGADQVLRGEVLDISQTGLCLLTDALVVSGNRLHLDFELSGARIELVAEVRWVKPRDDGLHEVGLRVARIAAPSQQAMAKAATSGRWSPRVVTTH